MRTPRLLAASAFAAAILLHPMRVGAQPDGAALIRLMGARAWHVFAPSGAVGMGGLVRLPSGVRAADLGLTEIVPGIARIWGPPSSIVSFGARHPDLRVEVSPPVHLLLDNAAVYVAAPAANASGFDGRNVLVGIADTGIDLSHPDFLDASGGTRVAWLLDLSSPPLGRYPDLEKAFGSTDATGAVAFGAVWAKSDIDAKLHAGSASGLPQDEIGHGTLVASCAAGGDSRYRGIAPKAGLLIARIVSGSSGGIGSDELVRGAAFLFDRADFMQLPVAVNLSIGTDFGPHDGSLAWEQTLAAYVGAQHPGHALIAAAGNSGSVANSPAIHQSVHVAEGTVRVPVLTASAHEGTVQVWVAMHAGSSLSVGVDAPDRTWVAPVAPGASSAKDSASVTVAVYNGSGAKGSPVPQQSMGAVVIWQGTWASGTYYVTLSGSGTADLYLQATDDAFDTGFADGVRESTINLPATHPAIIGVGCTINKKSWVSIDGSRLGLHVPILDGAGGEPAGSAERDPQDGEPCWFSSAGPTLTGVPKPEIMAPGAAIAGALSQQAVPPGPASIFTGPDCAASATAASGDPSCEVIDTLHAVSLGTSFSAPLVAGAAAVLFQSDPTLTQDQIVAALQGGAHPLRSTGSAAAAPFNDQAGPGELDVAGALAVVNRLRDPRRALPVRANSWMSLGADFCLADGSTPVRAVIELRAGVDASGEAPAADGFEPGRLVAYAFVDASMIDGRLPLERRGPGVWLATVQVPPGLGGSRLTVGAAFDGVDIVDRKTIPIATDAWNAVYPPALNGGCGLAETQTRRGRAARATLASATTLAFTLWAGVATRRRVKRREARRGGGRE
jgi:Subtilase family